MEIINIAQIRKPSRSKRLSPQKVSLDLMENIKAKGILVPLLLDKQKNIVDGLQRYHAALILRITQVPVEYLDRLR